MPVVESGEVGRGREGRGEEGGAWKGGWVREVVVGGGRGGGVVELDFTLMLVLDFRIR